MRRLLFIRLDHIGDVAMSLPALHALRQRYPDARIDALVLPEVAPLLADVSDMDAIYSLCRARLHPRPPQAGRPGNAGADPPPAPRPL